jgi:UDP-GlcNAc:undecaprenyl-phosphate GlcNAc-1-phosphate transferase
MHAFSVLGISAFVFCLALTPIVRDIFLKFGLVDQPDGGRKFHARAVPRIGGIPIVLSYAGALLVVFYLNPGGGRIYIQHERMFDALLPAAAIIFLTGLIDDIRPLRPWQKLGGQFAGALMAVSLGARLAIFPNHPSISFVLSIIWLIGCSNAVNLIDGMDGLATGVGLFATLTTLLVALIAGNYGLALATVPLVGCLLAFLRYNFAPASVFLGDCGSLTIGFVLGCFGLIWSQRTGTLLGMLGPLMALALPLLDVMLAIGRRFLRKSPIFHPDRSHIHHMILRLGFSTRDAALLLYAVCGLCASLAVLETVSMRGMHWPILIFFCALVLFGIDRLGYVEFKAARKILFGSSVRSAVKDEIYLHELEQSLSEADGLDAWWSIVCKTCSELRFATAQFEFEGRFYQEQFAATSEQPSCRIHLGSEDCGYLVLTRVPESAPPRLMMPVLHRLHASLEKQATQVTLAANASETVHTANSMQTTTAA